MYFDKLCSITERHFPNLAPLLHEARLFIFPGKAHEMIKPNIVAKQVENQDLFQLPFPVVAVEDPGSCIIISDTQKNTKGIDNPRFFVEYIPDCVESDAFDPHFDSKEEREKWNLMRSKDKRSIAGILSYGRIDTIKFFNQNEDWRVDGVITGCFFVSKKDKPKNVLEHFQSKPHLVDDFQKIKRSFLNNCSVSLRELFLFNHPDFFILQEEPLSVKPKKGKKKDMIFRSHERPNYTALRPTQIREKLGLQQPVKKRGSPIPHERRAHLRRLKKESGYKEDKIVSVKASWIGDNEKTIKNKRYKVILDK